MSFDEPMSAARLELSIRDVLRDPELAPGDERVFTAIAEI
jgi:hypothetical protein